MIYVRTYRYKLKPTKAQELQFEQWVGACRFVYNLCLEYRQVMWRFHKLSVSKSDLKKEIAQIAKETPWLRAMKAQTIQAAIDRLDNAFINFYKGKKGYPKFAKKGRFASFEYWQNVRITHESSLIKLPKIGFVKMFYSRPCHGVIKQAQIKKFVDGWYVTVVVEEEIAPLPRIEKTVGLDLGLKSLITSSDGLKISNPRHLHKKEKKLIRLQRNVTRKKRGSCNRKKAVRKLASQYLKVANARKDYQQKLTTQLIRDNQTIVVEELNVVDLLKNNHLAKSIGDAGWGELVAMLEYKAKWYGRNLYKVPAHYTSKTCSSCGFINQSLTLDIRQWQCPLCFTEHDRDINAAINIKNRAEGHSVSA
ncbi:RNA-guided endonuclease InsQ/TnpB family protein [Spirosoma sordidisoli]|uniref:Transposase n=1 Tax=Spirosoma sordidisoli TaxID=2502893 RepID=A0A4Q2UT05_9BACT|nr:RNA-guided endonuclease TnpB family protein [Spirosoma sordidisoli]RYC70870.1 transposase [Spirosoma sordidisoli]